MVVLKVEVFGHYHLFFLGIPQHSEFCEGPPTKREEQTSMASKNELVTGPHK